MNQYTSVALGAVLSACLLLAYFAPRQSIDQSIAAKDSEDSFPRPPFSTFIFGVGIVEAGSGNISIGTPINRIVEKIPVSVGMDVNKGEELIQFENQDLQAELIIQELAYQQAQARMKKLKSLPRSEDILLSEAELKNGEIELAQAQSQFEMIKNLKDIRALSQEEINRRSFAVQLAEAKLQQARASYEKVKAGVWEPDLDIAKIEAMQAKAEVMRIKSKIQQTVIKSPIHGKVLQINVHEGEIPSRMPLMVLGNVDEMTLKVSINQFDLPDFHANAPAVAFLQGNDQYEFPLHFLYIEPILVDKQNLTHDIMEKIDVEVLNAYYKIESGNKKLFVGQQMDVYIQTQLTQND